MGFETTMCLLKWKTLSIECVVFYIYENTCLDLKESTESCIGEAVFAKVDLLLFSMRTTSGVKAERELEEIRGAKGHGVCGHSGCLACASAHGRQSSQNLCTARLTAASHIAQVILRNAKPLL